jgi:hypothetical protein
VGEGEEGGWEMKDEDIPLDEAWVCCQCGATTRYPWYDCWNYYGPWRFCRSCVDKNDMEPDHAWYKEFFEKHGVNR